MSNLPLRFLFKSLFLVWAISIINGESIAAESATVSSPWEAEIKAFEAGDKINAPTTGGILLVGSSSIGLWKNPAQDFPGFDIIQRGFGGAQIADVIAVADRIILPYRPRQILLYAGDNDIASGKSPEQVLQDLKSLVADIHAKLPKAQISFISIKPSPSRWHLADQVRKANALIQVYAAAAHPLEFIDVFSPMLGSDGKPRPELFQADNLHLNRQGYDLWVKLIKPRLKRAR